MTWMSNYTPLVYVAVTTYPCFKTLSWINLPVSVDESHGIQFYIAIYRNELGWKSETFGEYCYSSAY